MTLPSDRSTSNDPRWGDHVPWSLRYNALSQEGDFNKFFSLLGARLRDMFLFGEAGIPNLPHFGACIATESLGGFPHNNENNLPPQILAFFAPATLEAESQYRTTQDPEEKTARSLKHSAGSEDHVKAIAMAGSTRLTRHKTHLGILIAVRLEVLQSILVLLTKHQINNALPGLVRDIRRFAAESNISLDIKGNPPTVVPIEEPLLQKEVIDKLLPRLEAKYPERAADITKAYHDLLKGIDTNTVFGNAFKALEELGRQISGVAGLELSDRQALERAFPNLHGTIRETIIKLAAHRGDEGAHGRKGPDEYEIRYLLLAICNFALLLLEYQEQCG